EVLVTVDVTLEKIGIEKHAAIPWVVKACARDAIEKVGAAVGADAQPGARVPWACIAAARAFSAVEIPNRPHLQFLIAVFEEEGAQAEGVDVDGQHVEQVVIVPRFDID